MTCLLTSSGAGATIAAGEGRHLPLVGEIAANQRLRGSEVCSVMAVNDSGIPPILAQKHDTEPWAFAPENLLREACGPKRMTTSGMIAIAAGHLRSRRSP